MRPEGLSPPDWTAEAPCRLDPDRMFPHSRIRPGWRVRRAKAVCAPCPFKRECFEQYPMPVVAECMADGPERIHLIFRDSSEDGVWGSTSPQERRAVAHLPVPVRIEILLRWVGTQRLNGSRPPRLVQCAGEIATTWIGLGSPPEVPAATFAHVAGAFGGSTVTAARRRIGIVAKREADPDTGRVAGWRWEFSNVRV